MTHRVLTYVPGLYKIFDEILTYAADNKQRDPSMDSLRVEVDVDQCCISIYYNGRGVPIELHPEEGLYVPEMIFGHLSNYEEITGVKLANLFSTELFIETVDSRLEKKYKQGWRTPRFIGFLREFGKEVRAPDHSLLAETGQESHSSRTLQNFT
ncbi:DNA topoisomerase 2-like isoform X1 [Setaria viridis]|uniref:DNA topoisomerase 2-like isoform X1 n=1 Tax=Setaria viridis TaxID=4556 RepID=UPI003B3B7A3D